MSHSDPEAGASSSSTPRHHNQTCQVESCEVASESLSKGKLLKFFHEP